MKTALTLTQPPQTPREKVVVRLLYSLIPIYRLFYSRRKPWGITKEGLLQYPEGSLGKDIGKFLEAQGLEIVPVGERHDVCHTLLEFGTNIREESSMKVFLFGNGRYTPFTIAAAVFVLFLLPEMWPRFWKEYKRGSSARCINKWKLEEMLYDSTEDIRNIIFKRPVQNLALLQKIAKWEQA